MVTDVSSGPWVYTHAKEWRDGVAVMRVQVRASSQRAYQDVQVSPRARTMAGQPQVSLPMERADSTCQTQGEAQHGRIGSQATGSFGPGVECTLGLRQQVVLLHV